MYKKILVAVDGSELAEAAVSLAIAVGKATAARLCLVHVEDSGPMGRARMPAPAKYLDDLARTAANDLYESVDTAVLRPGDDSHVSKGDTAAIISKYAGEHSYDLIVVSTRGHSGLKRVFEGSLAEELLRVTPCPVLFCRPSSGLHASRPGRSAIKKLLIALDQTERSEAILEKAVAFAKQVEAEVTLVHVLQPLRATATVTGMELAAYSADEWNELNTRTDTYLAGVRQRLISAGLEATAEKLVSNDVAASILERASQLKVDTIAVASKAPQRLVRAILGSVADQLVRNAECPVLVIRATS
jgi:nucleotide-binding universal stress UspA family protein